ncbi:MAG TPA: GNAT family protein [Solirubrobacterales bacterium]|nr:GNAT family protein [Solirubrobacterales bacterium]
MIWPPPDRALEGSLVRLEPLVEEHREPLRSIAGHPEIWEWIDRRVAEDEDGFDQFFDGRLLARKMGDEHGYATLGADSGEPLGSSSFLAPRPLHDGVEVGITWLTPSAWRSGANVEAKLLMLGFAFEELGCMRVELKTDSRNERSREAMEALPAQFEGIFRKHMQMPGIGIRDSAYFSIVDDEWPSVRANLEQRLAGAREVGSA